MAVTCHYPLIFKGKLIIKFLFMWLFIPLMSKFCWIQPAQCKNYCLILYIRKMLQILSILYTGGPQLLLCICILWTSAKDRSVQRQNREDRWFPRHKGCHVKMHPCTVRRGLVGWLGVQRHLMSYLQCRRDISTLAFRSNSNSHSDCDSQHQTGDSLSDLNSCLHWSNSRSNLGVAWHDKVKCWGYSHRSTTNEAIFKPWVITHVVLNELCLKLRFSCRSLKDGWKGWVSEHCHSTNTKSFKFAKSPVNAKLSRSI